MEGTLVPAPFQQLLARLGDQHEADVQAAVRALEVENGRLWEEIAQLRRTGPPRPEAPTETAPPALECGEPGRCAAGTAGRPRCSWAASLAPLGAPLEPEALIEPPPPVWEGGEPGRCGGADLAGQPRRAAAASAAPQGAPEPEALLEPVLPSARSGGPGWRGQTSSAASWADDGVCLAQDARGARASCHWPPAPPVAGARAGSKASWSAEGRGTTSQRRSSRVSLLWQDDDVRGEVVDLPGPAGVARRSVKIPVGELSRFCEMFEVGVQEAREATISAEKLTRVLHGRGVRDVTQARVSSVLLQLVGCSSTRSVGPSRGAPIKSGTVDDLPRVAFAEPGADVPFTALVAVLTAKDIDTGLDAVVIKEVELWRQALTQDIDEVIARVSGEKKADDVTRIRSTMSSVTDAKYAFVPCRWSRSAKLRTMNVAVTTSVVLSLVSMSLRSDYFQGSPMWLVIEIACATVFLAELLEKWRILGCQAFLLGPDRWWHFSDVFLTIVQIVDVMLFHAGQGEESQPLVLLNLAVCLKIARVVRFARLLKTMRSSLGRELANMLSGFMIGIPALLWVLVLIFFGVWMIATFTRYVIGPLPGQDRRGTCGVLTGDDWNESVHGNRTECEQHLLYAEEFCPDVPTCMFTIFRCIVGECTSDGGHSLPAHLTTGYGPFFAVLYCVGMVVIIFGLFNKITAVFVESTMKNMTADEAKVKQRTTYRSRHVRKNLEELVRRIWMIQEGIECDAARAKRLFRRSGFGHSSSSWRSSIWTRKEEEDEEEQEWSLSEASHISLSESAFYNVLDDAKVQRILEGLDIDVSTSSAGIFGIFKVDDKGEVPLPELLGKLMKLRGGTSKADLVAPSVLISWLADEVQDTQNMVRALLDSRPAVPGSAGPLALRGGAGG